MELPSQSSSKTVHSDRHVAVLVDTATNWGRRIVTGINGFMRTTENWRIFFEPRGPFEPMRLPSGWRGDGVIARVSSTEMVEHLQGSGLPVVNVSAINLPRQPFPTVANDMEEVARSSADYFIDRGFRNFAYLSLIGLEYVERQRSAFVAAVGERGFACAVREIPLRAGSQQPDWSLNLDDLGRWIAALPKPLAVLTWSGAREIIHSCQLAGMRVPEDVAVLAAMDNFECQISSIPVSAVELDGERIGYEAARTLNASWQSGQSSESRKLFPPKGIITRQSTDIFAVADPAVATALHYIRTHLDQAIQVEDIARHAGVSRRVLERRFQDLLQRSPGEDLRRSRLCKAELLLEQSDLPIYEVAERSGFGSPEYLTVVFRREKKQSPLKYRRKFSGFF